MTICIAGAGIGGLAAALALHRNGFDVRVLERAAAPEEIGAGLQISPNGMHVLRALGVADALEAAMFRPEAAQLRRGRNGRVIFSLPLAEEAVRRYGAPYCSVHRSDLHGALLDALEARAPGAVRHDADITGFRQDDRGVTLTCRNGSITRGVALIGADGIHSIVRRGLFGVSPPRFTGHVAWRLVVPADRVPPGLIPPAATVWAGPGGHVVTYYLRGGALINLVGVREQARWTADSWTARGRKTDMLRDFAWWGAPVQAVLQAAEANACFTWALHDLNPLPQWSRGRVTLLGDACHPALPFLAQGATMALEDAFVAATALSRRPDDPAAALRAYEARRKTRTARVQRASRAAAGMYHRARGAGLAIHAPLWLAARMMPGFLQRRGDWIYGCNVTEPNGATSSSG